MSRMAQDLDRIQKQVNKETTCLYIYTFLAYPIDLQGEQLVSNSLFYNDKFDTDFIPIYQVLTITDRCVVWIYID